MKFYRLSEIPRVDIGPTFKASLVGSLISLVVFLAIGISLLIIGIKGGIVGGGAHLTSGLAYFIAATFGFLPALICFGSCRAILKPTNWLLRCGADGLLIKYRSCANWRMPATDIQVVRFDYSEIAWARRVKEWQNLPVGLGGKTERTQMQLLEIGLKNVDTAVLDQRLAAEQTREWSYTVRTYPVSLQPGGVLRLQWQGAGGSWPDAAKAIAWLGRFVPTLPEDSSEVDLTLQPNLSPEQTEARITKLIGAGNEIAAIAMVRQARQCSLAEAKQVVNDLRSKTTT